MVIVSSHYDFILDSPVKKRRQIGLCFKYETGISGSPLIKKYIFIRLINTVGLHV